MGATEPVRITRSMWSPLCLAPNRQRHMWTLEQVGCLSSGSDSGWTVLGLCPSGFCPSGCSGICGVGLQPCCLAQEVDAGGAPLRWGSELTLSRRVREGFLEEVMLKLNLTTCKDWREREGRKKGRDLSLVEEAVRLQNRQESRWFPVCRKPLIDILKINDSGIFSLGI